ncbi:DUF2569 domain-containing protein [Desulfovibrio sp. OttesenSCG-928-C06]|nr:DUF2569 domain-containing protein [Desulfovibrio sp. OttesenSCG-928-C06]
MQDQQNQGQEYIQPGPADAYQSADPAKVAAIAEQLERERLTGIGGWLLVFLILTILGLLSQVFSLLSPGTGIRELDTLVMPRSLISLLMGIAVLVLLFGKKAVFPKVVKIYLVIESVLSVIFTIMTVNAVSAYIGNMDAAFSGGMFVGVAVSVGLSIAWIVYFSKSKRVRYTFVE